MSSEDSYEYLEKICNKLDWILLWVFLIFMEGCWK